MGKGAGKGAIGFSILDDGTNQTAATPMDHKLFKHAMNAPIGSGYLKGVEVGLINDEAAISILIPEGYER